MTPPTFQHLGAFWQNFCIHKRKSDYSNADIVSVFPASCPYPVWHKDEWLEHANPPSAEFNFEEDFFQQLWEVFSKSPIPHNVGIGSENCEYTDDCWYSKNCYLCHSIGWCEDCRYIYRNVRLKDCYFCVYCFDCSRSIDLSYCFDCSSVKYAIDSKRCQNSAFLYDCQDCEDCLLCWNQRNKRYCIANTQYSKEEYEKELKKYTLSSRSVYKKLEQQFSEYIKTHAYWKNLHLESTEKSTGDYLKNTKNCTDCYLVDESQDCENTLRCFQARNSKNSISVFDGDKIVNTSMAQDACYNISHCCDVNRCKNLDYCAHCYECEDCFASCGLVGKKYYILNKEYSPEAYTRLKEKIISHLQDTGVYGEFFPAYFSATSYDESLASFYFPLSIEEQKAQGYRTRVEESYNKDEYTDISLLPDITGDESIGSYWDQERKRPFQISKEDVQFYKKIGAPVHDTFYISRFLKNYRWMFPGLRLRTTTCSISGKQIQTTLPEFLDSRIASEEEYNKIIY